MVLKILQRKIRALCKALMIPKEKWVRVAWHRLPPKKDRCGEYGSDYLPGSYLIELNPRHARNVQYVCHTLGHEFGHYCVEYFGIPFRVYRNIPKDDPTQPEERFCNEVAGNLAMTMFVFRCPHCGKEVW